MIARRAILFTSMLLLAACDPGRVLDERPIAAGSLSAILNASRIARRCGVRDTRLDPVGGRKAVLMLGHNHAEEAESCLTRWLATHPRGLDPALLRQVTNA